MTNFSLNKNMSKKALSRKGLAKNVNEMTDKDYYMVFDTLFNEEVAKR